MAVTVTPTIELINLDRSEAKLTAIIDDGEGDIRTTTASGPMNNAAEKKAVADAALRNYNAELAKEPLIAAKITELEGDAKDYMEGVLNG